METNIERPVAVHVQLKRFLDGEVSDPKTFTYYPQQTGQNDPFNYLTEVFLRLSSVNLKR